MDVFDALRRLPGKPRSIEIIDVRVLAVEYIEDIDKRTDASPFAPGAKVDEQGPSGLDALVLDQRIFAEVAQSRGGEPAAVAARRDPAADDERDRPGNMVAGRVRIAKFRPSVGDFQLAVQILGREVIQAEFQQAPSAKAAVAAMAMAKREMFMMIASISCSATTLVTARSCIIIYRVPSGPAGGRHFRPGIQLTNGLLGI